jgi:hypothetical protein
VKTVSEIRPVKEARENDLLKLPGVTGVDIGPKYVGGEKTDELSIRVYVEEKKDLESVPSAERIPKTVKGIKTDVIQRKWVLHPLMMAVADMQLMKDTGKYDPLRGGMSIGPCRSVYLDATQAACHGASSAGYYYFTGTLGAIVIDNATNAEMLLSNFHVMCIDNGWHVGDQMAQPSIPDGGNCPTDVVGTLQRSALTSTVDAAVASHTARGHQCSILDIGNVTGTATATEGMAVRKRGRTTGLTYGTVDSVDLSVNVNYCDGIGVRTFYHQIGIAVDISKSPQFGAGGDSGSVVVDDNGKIVGLYFAGDETGQSGVANPIQDVLTALNVHVCVPFKKIEAEPIIKKLEKLEHDVVKNEKLEHDIVKKQEKTEQDIVKNYKAEHDVIKKQEKSEQDVVTKQQEPYKGIEPFKGSEPYKYTEPISPIVGGPPVGPSPAGVPTGGTIEERLARLEAAVAQLTHFIAPASRPEMEKGPLQNEPGSTQR